MGLKVEVTGAAALHDLALRLHRAARTDLKRELDRSLRKAATADVADAIRDRSDDYMPHGYEAVFKASLHFKTEVRTSYDTRITLIVRARGVQGHDRQVRELEAGGFRVPNWGRWRARRGINRGRHKLRNKWHDQRVRAHFATEPAERARPRVIERVDEAMAAVVRKIED